MFDVSTTGASVTIKSTVTLPVPVPITHFADDKEPFQIDDQEITGHGMGINGDLVVYTKPVPVTCSVSVVANSPDDIALYTLFRMNKCTSATHAFDIVDMSIVIPNIAKPFRYVNGKILAGPPGPTSSNDGKNQSHTYKFVFEKEQI